MTKPETRYAQSGKVSIAYQVMGRGPVDLIFVPGFVSHLEHLWRQPDAARFFERLASFTRLIRFDKRGTGLSDRTVGIPTLEERMDDIRAVMDETASSSAIVFGYSEGGSMAALFSAMYPERTAALILYGTYARRAWAADYPWGRTREEHEAMLTSRRATWGTGVTIAAYASQAADAPYREWWAEYERVSASPGAVVALLEMNWEIDVRPVLPSIRVPTLVLHRLGDQAVTIDQGRFIAQRIPGAKYVELAGTDHSPFHGGAGLLAEVEEFVTGVRPAPEPDRVLATVLFTDIVGATERAASLGDAGWRDLLERHHAVVRHELDRFRGREIDTAGDGFLAAFDGPARGVRAAVAIADAVRGLGLQIRAGLHTGECEIMGDKLSGIAVHIGARVSALAPPGEVLVSSTVKDLVAGSGLRFRERGTHELKGVPGAWQLYLAEKD